MSMFGDAFGPKMGSWGVESKKDPRWNKTGRGEGLICTGGPRDLQDWVEQCRNNFGSVPDDAEYWFFKD
jgi:hypothetical protein